jgi:hypothetical protein
MQAAALQCDVPPEQDDVSPAPDCDEQWALQYDEPPEQYDEPPAQDDASPAPDYG